MTKERERLFPKPHLLAWDQEYAHIRWGGPASIASIKAYLPEGARVLDAGSGDGRYLKELAKYFRSTGVDVSFRALCSSKERLVKNGFLAEHVTASLQTLPFRNNSFEALLCYGVLQHLFFSERKAALREFERVLGKRGLVFFEAFGTEDMRYGGEVAAPSGKNPEKNTFLRQSGIIYHYFTKKEILSLFEGFEVLEFQEIKKEKKFRGKRYIRQQFRAVFREGKV